MMSTDDDVSKMGPQGTQVFEVDEINKMVAKEIIESQSENANMPALIGVSSDVVGKQYILRKDKIEVGRRPSSDIVLTESSVSSMHAQVIQSEGEWKILNLLSSNGTFVNGDKVVDQILKPGDMVSFASSEFVFSLVEDDREEESVSSNKNYLPFIVAGVAGLGALVWFFLT
ncbi:MAG: FHA domain-containing protein [Kangiellaceae bacterium]